MSLPDMAAWPLWVNLVVFLGAAGAVWAGGMRLSRYADTFAERTGLGRAYLGVLLLGGVTSLPEVAATTTASFSGKAPLAVNTLLGGVMMQTTILALADVLVGREALSTVGAMSEELLEEVLLVGALSIVAVGIAVGPVLLEALAQVAALLGILMTAIHLAGIIERRDRTVLRMGWDSVFVLIYYAAGLFLLYALR